MKKIIWMIFMGMLPLGLLAQGMISFGPKIGWNSTRLSTDYSDYVKDIKSGCQGGAFFSLYLKKFYLQPEAYFSFKRGALTTSIDPLHPINSVEIKQSVTLYSIDVPLIFGYKVLDLKLARFRIWAGPVVSFLLDKNYTLSVGGSNLSDSINSSDFKNSLWSAQVGAGVDLLFLTFDVGYQLGFEKFLDLHYIDNFGIRKNMLYCSLGWRLM